MQKKTVLFALVALAVTIAMIVIGAYLYFAPLAGFKITQNIEYAPRAEGSRPAAHLLDVYEPKFRMPFEKPRPLIIWIHGGSWLMGDKSSTLAQYLPMCGYVGASINYRYSTEKKFPAQIEDVRTAIKYLRENSARYNFDPDRIGVWGQSAGGHLAALAGVNLGKDVSPVQAVCDWCGPADLITLASQAGPDNVFDANDVNGAIAKLLGGVPGKDKAATELAKEASPVTYVRKELPPFLVVHGDNDQVIPVEQSIEFIDKLKAAGADCELQLVHGGRHNFTTTDIVFDSVHFFDEKLKRP